SALANVTVPSSRHAVTDPAGLPSTRYEATHCSSGVTGVPVCVPARNSLLHWWSSCGDPTVTSPRPEPGSVPAPTEETVAAASRANQAATSSGRGAVARATASTGAVAHAQTDARAMTTSVHGGAQHATPPGPART